MTETTKLYCYAHPTRETTLRCKRCERPMCASCAVRTPTGYMCKDCVRERQKNFDTALWYDYVSGVAVTAILSLITSILLIIISSFIGLFGILVAVFAAGGAGVVISNVTLRVLKRRRSRILFILCAVGVVLGALPVGLVLLFSGNLFALLSLAIYVVIAAPTVYTRTSGIQL